MTEGRNLILVSLLERPGSRGYRQLAKVQGTGLLRSLFGGQVVVERNFPEPVLALERVGLKELEHDPADFLPDEVNTRAIKARVESAVRHAETASQYGWVVFLDADVVPLRNWDHLLARRDAEVLVSRLGERRGESLLDKERAGSSLHLGHAGSSPYDAGMFAVRGEIVVEFARRWMEEFLNVERRTWKAEHRIGGELETAKERRADEVALEAVLGSCEWKIREFERGEVVRAFEEGTGMADVINAAAVHLRGGSAEEKRKLAFALHMMWVYGDKDGVFLDILEG